MFSEASGLVRRVTSETTNLGNMMMDRAYIKFLLTWLSRKLVTMSQVRHSGFVGNQNNMLSLELVSEQLMTETSP